MKLTFLGTGTSQGVPVIGCRCEVCRSRDARDMRLRTSAFVEVEGRAIVIDAGPDFRQQMLRADIRHLDAILLTHQHKDHTAGIDDVRAFNFVDFPTIHPMHIFGNEATIETITKDFDYAFAPNPYRGVPQMELHEFGSEPFEERVGENKWSLMLGLPTSIMHQHKVESWDGLQLKVNLYKCGDNLSKPHFLSWQPIALPQPCFHCPEFFTAIELE